MVATAQRLWWDDHLHRLPRMAHAAVLDMIFVSGRCSPETLQIRPTTDALPAGILTLCSRIPPAFHFPTTSALQVLTGPLSAQLTERKQVVATRNCIIDTLNSQLGTFRADSDAECSPTSVRPATIAPPTPEPPIGCRATQVEMLPANGQVLHIGEDIAPSQASAGRRLGRPEISAFRDVAHEFAIPGLLEQFGQCDTIIACWVRTSFRTKALKSQSSRPIQLAPSSYPRAIGEFPPRSRTLSTLFRRHLSGTQHLQ
ncbi:hypothetical protein GBZ48_33890 [Azospirillum melinis]|uniref:Uncharacterized protein n=1 Tax=Azospirillum melinis TaxID=328839 RepID=A0ABX2KM66_9PROT|nr:hypothetical protein [Azospirillum melinis]MBP2310697.1 hypothetical protein [Azospirillum melinis]NUB04204.1 hypothetical protein [Azospirillum melinis]